MKYDKQSFTYGVELEFADVYRFNELPPGCDWNLKDITIVNSTGIANDPTGRLWEYGGEINTRPTNTISHQVFVIERVIKELTPPPFINYRCNLHIHIGVPGLRNDIKALKSLLTYIRSNAREAFSIVEPIPKPIESDFESKDAFKGAMARYRRRLVSHQYMLYDKTVKKILSDETKTPMEFWDNHANRSKDGKAFWYITPRAAINLRQIFETNTIEFRHFPGTLDPDEYYSCLFWCSEFIYAALNNHKIKPDRIFRDNRKDLIFPKFRRYIHQIDLLWRRTNLGKNTRQKVRSNIDEIISNKQLLDIGLYQHKSSLLESGYPREGLRKWI